MKYPDPDDETKFVPLATGQVLDPLELGREECDALLGPGFYDVLKAASERMARIGPRQYRIVPARES